MAQNIKPSDEELKNYFEQNKKNYYINAPQKKIRYIFLNTSKIGEKLPISDAELQAEYDNIPADKKQAGVQGQQIVLRIPKPELEAQIVQKANEIVTQARKDGDTISARSLYATRQRLFGRRGEQSQRRNNCRFGQGKQTKSDRSVSETFDDAAGRSDRADQISKIVFLFCDAAKPCRKLLKTRRRKSKFHCEIVKVTPPPPISRRKLTTDLKETKDVQKTAQKFAAQANMSATEMVRETGFVKPGDTVENIGNSPQFEEGIARSE